jgi:hypothetical protein
MLIRTASSENIITNTELDMMGKEADGLLLEYIPAICWEEQVLQP